MIAGRHATNMHLRLLRSTSIWLPQSNSENVSSHRSRRTSGNKKIRPRISPRPDPYTARGVHPPAPPSTVDFTSLKAGAISARCLIMRSPCPIPHAIKNGSLAGPSAQRHHTLARRMRDIAPAKFEALKPAVRPRASAMPNRAPARTRSVPATRQAAVEATAYASCARKGVITKNIAVLARCPRTAGTGNARSGSIDLPSGARLIDGHNSDK
jgi:hypothetical protein